ncbi:cytidine deaminase [Megasphaera sp. An286]|uniref:cytidine deaminase n=1 Tax=Megasphaera sp. An286 TaxID=1965622 RepID=UPI000B3BC658|nr:cytidine deaminase [Megasphaera sp. An286]OUO47396.1 cytidine deaminase [Megasphaera sp. An286]
MDGETVRLLIEAAKKARERAYAPYSQFYVGAAALGEDGVIYAGCNVENSSYGLSCCAERNAIFRGVAAGCRKFEAVAIVGNADDTMPCGACRQVMAEFGVSYVVATCADGAYRVLALEDLLPFAFTLQEETE